MLEMALFESYHGSSLVHGNPADGQGRAKGIGVTTAYEGLGPVPKQTSNATARDAAGVAGGSYGSAGETTAVFAPLSDVADPMDPGDDLEGLRTLPPRRPHRTALIVVFATLCALVLLAVGAAFGAHWYFRDRVAPGVSFGGVSVLGQSRQQLVSTVKKAVDDSTVTVRDAQGTVRKASLDDLGVSVDVSTTVNDLIAAKSGNALSRINPFASRRISLSANVNKLTLSEYLTSSFVTSDQRAVPSSISYSSGSHTFTVQDGKKGLAPDSLPVQRTVDSLIAHPGVARTVKIDYTNVGMPITVQAAQKTADTANSRLGNGIVIANANGKTFQVPTDVVASWITPVSDPTRGSIALSVNKEAIVSYMASQLPAQLDQSMVSQVNIVNSAGKFMVTSVQGIDGFAVKNTADVAGKVYSALSNGQPANITAQGAVTAHDVKQQKSDTRIVVDKTKQTASVYKNDQLVKTFNVCTGGPGKDETDNGTFFIYLTYQTQDMRGLNDDGTPYLSKGVKWVSYFNGGEGFHTANWNYAAIASGDPAHYGSHGCVNMYEQDAEWIYQNCPKGTLVQVTGTQPTAPVR